MIGGRFEVVRLLGRGGFGAVYLAIQRPLDRKVALKILAPEHVGRPEARDRFLREARTMARVNHPLVVGVIDYGVTAGGLAYIALEYVDGVELKDVVRRSAPLGVERTSRICLDILHALEAAHALGLVHRDLKPSNVMATTTPLGGEAYKLLDFGLARTVEPGADDFRTRSGVLIGTPKYMAPEQALARPVGPAADQYALGVMMFEMLTGRPPFEGQTSFEILAGHQFSPAPRIGDIRQVPAALEAIVQRALAKRPDERFDSVTEMRLALEAVVPSAGRPRGGPEPGGADRRALPPPVTRAGRDITSLSIQPAAAGSSGRAVADRTESQMRGESVPVEWTSPDRSAGDDHPIERGGGRTSRRALLAVTVAGLAGAGAWAAWFAVGRHQPSRGSGDAPGRSASRADLSPRVTHPPAVAPGPDPAAAEDDPSDAALDVVSAPPRAPERDAAASPPRSRRSTRPRPRGAEPRRAARREAPEPRAAVPTEAPSPIEDPPALPRLDEAPGAPSSGPTPPPPPGGMPRF